MHGRQHAQPQSLARPELARRVAKGLGIGEMSLNEVDFDDLFVSETVVNTMHELAMNILKQAASPEEEPKISAYWVEASGELVLCADSGKGLHLVRVPGEHWTIKPHVYH